MTPKSLHLPALGRMEESDWHANAVGRNSSSNSNMMTDKQAPPGDDLARCDVPLLKKVVSRNQDYYEVSLLK
jgi:hypothetical protein